MLKCLSAACLVFPAMVLAKANTVWLVPFLDIHKLSPFCVVLASKSLKCPFSGVKDQPYLQPLSRRYSYRHSQYGSYS